MIAKFAKFSVLWYSGRRNNYTVKATVCHNLTNTFFYGIVYIVNKLVMDLGGI